MPNKPMFVGFLLCIIAGGVGWFARQSAIAVPEISGAAAQTALVPAAANPSHAQLVSHAKPANP